MRNYLQQQVHINTTIPPNIMPNGTVRLVFKFTTYIEAKFQTGNAKTR
ncbi:MAG: hypothetical protein R2765_10715 [Ferruginibacter sp.]